MSTSSEKGSAARLVEAAQHNGSVQRPRFVPVHQDDELAQPLIAELAVEYATRYDGTEARVLTWLRGYPAEEFSPPDGGMLIGLVDGQPVTGGAFRRFDADTAELKRFGPTAATGGAAMPRCFSRCWSPRSPGGDTAGST